MECVFTHFVICGALHIHIRVTVKSYLLQLSFSTYIISTGETQFQGQMMTKVANCVGMEHRLKFCVFDRFMSNTII